MDWDHFRWLVRRRPVLRVSLGYFDVGRGYLDPFWDAPDY